jgi:glycine betaine catabolism B
MKQQIAERYAGADEVEASIAALTEDCTDHWADTREVIDTYHPKRLHLQISEVVRETDSTTTFRLRRPDGGLLPPFLAGQYVAVFVDGTSRPFAISSSPARRDHYDLTVKRVPGGRVSNLMLDTWGVGDAVLTGGPMGTFFHNPLFHGDDVVFVAGGSGVAPAMSMIRDILDNDLDRRFRLVYGSRGDVIFADELRGIDDARITVDLVLDNDGLITAEDLGQLGDRMVYVCGPPVMYPYALGLLEGLGHPRRRVRFEANGPPMDVTREPSWPADAPETASVTTRRGRFETRCDRPLLDALEDEGIAVESACRSGECSLCRVRVKSGQVYSADQALMRRSDAHYVHSCVAYPVGDVELDL